MTDKRTAANADADAGNTREDPQDWVTGDEPMTGAQRSCLKTLSEKAHVDFDDGLTKAAASRRIEALQQRTGRGERPADAADPARHPGPGQAPGHVGPAAEGRREIPPVHPPEGAPPESGVGEEDPGAALDAPDGNDPARRSLERAEGQERAAIDNMREGFDRP